MKKAKVAIPVVASAFCVAYFGANVSATDYTINTAADLKTAVTEIAAGSNASHTITLGADIDIADTSVFAGKITFGGGNTVTIIGNGKTLKMAAAPVKIAVEDSAILNLGDGNSALVISGADENSGTGDSLVSLYSAATLNMKSGVTLKSNKSGAALAGSAVRLGNGTAFNMLGGTIEDCHSYSSMVGAAIVLDYSNATFKMDAGEIKNNSGTDYGGAVYMTSSNDNKVIINGGSFSNNHAKYGGAIIATAGSLSIKNATFSNNGSDSGSSRGGAVYYQGSSALTIENSTFSANGAYIGGAVAAYGNDYVLTVRNNTFDGNSAGLGGALYNRAGTSATSENNIFKNNEANKGGAIYTTRAIVSKGDDITDNRAYQLGGGVYVADLSNNTADFSESAIYNNKAVVPDGAAEGATAGANDVYIGASAAVTLPDTAAMSKSAEFDGNTYAINGWYTDNEDNRYSASNHTGAVSSTPTGAEYFLTAATDQDEAAPDSGDEPATPETVPENPPTGDNVAMYVAILGLSIVAGAVSLKMVKRR